MSSNTHNPTSSKHLEDQAAAAALYVTEPHKQTRDVRKEANWPLDANGKLTSAGAATSLKRADARDLPSFPSVGIAQSAAGGAALLANQNFKSPEYPKIEASAGASKAALMAHDYKMKPLWQPEASAAGSKAALLAHQKGHGLNLWEPTASDKALIAATGAISGKMTKKETISEFGIDRYPDEKNAAKNALSAATRVHGSSVRSRNQDLGGLTDAEAERVRKQATTNLGADLYGSAPLIGPELEERKHQAGLHAAAVSMAQGMYGKRDEAYRSKVDAARAGSRAAHARGLDQDSDDEDGPMSFLGLHEAAQKLAERRLAAMRDPDAEYREHYGTQTSPPKSRLSMFAGASQKKRDSDDEDDDRKNSRRIRGEMNLFQDKLKEIDARKRKDDREALLAAAQRNVRASIAGMDEDVFQKTGKMSPAMKADWEEKARQRAQAESENRNANYGKVALGGGKYMDQTEIDAIAQARLQPTLDAVTAKAEHDREVDEQNRIEEEERKRVAREAKEQERYNSMQVKEEWKRFRAEEKAEEQAHKQDAKLASQDARMQEKFEKSKEHETKEHQKLQEKEIHASEKEREKKLKEEWKAFKQQEKEEEKARKEEQRSSKGNRFSGIFRRKSKKEKDGQEAEPADDTVIPAGAGTTTTTISAVPAAAVEPPSTTTATTTNAAKATADTTAQEPLKHEEPHHNPLMPVEETPEARAANKQKPGGDLLQMLKRKKHEHDEEKHSKTEAAAAGATVGAVTGAAVHEDSALAGKDHPGKAQIPTTQPAPEAVAPEHIETSTGVSEAQTVPTQAEPPVASTASSAPLIASSIEPGSIRNDPHLIASRVFASPEEHSGESYESVVPATTTAATVTSDKVADAEKPAVRDAGHQSLAAAKEAPSPPATTSAAPAPVESISGTKPAQATIPVVPASVPVQESAVQPTQTQPAPVKQTAQTNSASTGTQVEPTPIVHDRVAPIPAPASSPPEEPAHAPKENSEHVAATKTAVTGSAIEPIARSAPESKPEPVTKTAEELSSESFSKAAITQAPASTPAHREFSLKDDGSAPSSSVVAPAAVATDGAENTAVGPQSAGPAAIGILRQNTDQIIPMGADKPVSSEVRHSLLDKLDPRVNAGKPGFEGSEKVASVFADMRGTDHAGASTTAASEPAAEKAMTQTETAQSAAAAPPASASAHKTGGHTASATETSSGAVATTGGQQRETPLAERIAVPAAASEAASEAAGSNQKGSHGTPRAAEQKKSHRLSGFFRNKFGSKIKEHRGTDGVTMTPTTQYTTKGKYVDPEDRHSDTHPVSIPANTASLEKDASSNEGASASAAAQSSSKVETSTQAAKTTTTHETHSTDASGIAIDPEYQGGNEPDVSPLSEEERGRFVASEEHEEARDTFDPDQLPLPKAPGSHRASESPARETRFKEQLFA